MTGIEPIYRMRYEDGADPIEVAVDAVVIELDARNAVLLGEVKYGNPITLLDQGDEPWARRIVARLLNAGWTPPQIAQAKEVS